MYLALFVWSFGDIDIPNVILFVLYLLNMYSIDLRCKLEEIL